MSSKPISVLLNRFLDPFIRSEYSKFTSFIRVFLEYMDEAGNVEAVLSDFLSLLDIDKIASSDPYAGNTEILELFIKQYLSSFPLYRIEDVDIAKLIKNSKDFYSSKGTEQSYQFLFNLMNHAGAFSFYYPDQDIMVCSDSTNGKLSDIKALHDNFYRAYYTYEIQSDLYGYAELKDIIENVLHPVGCKVFFLRNINIENESDPYSPTADYVFLFAFTDESYEWIEYLTNEIILHGITFQDLEDGSDGMISEMNFNDLGMTFEDIEQAAYSEKYFPHQLNVYKEIIT